MKWKVYGWNRNTRQWGQAGETDDDDRAEAAVRVIAEAGHVGRAESAEGEMRAHPGRGFYRLRWIKSGSEPGTS